MLVPSLSWQIILVDLKAQTQPAVFLLLPRAAAISTTTSSRSVTHPCSSGVQNAFVSHLYTENDHFAKTGSGQT
jgi:hypothetical protein